MFMKALKVSNKKKDNLEIKRVTLKLDDGYALNVEEVTKIPVEAMEYYKVSEF